MVLCNVMLISLLVIVHRIDYWQKLCTVDFVECKLKHSKGVADLNIFWNYDEETSSISNRAWWWGFALIVEVNTITQNGKFSFRFCRSCSRFHKNTIIGKSPYYLQIVRDVLIVILSHGWSSAHQTAEFTAAAREDLTQFTRIIIGTVYDLRSTVAKLVHFIWRRRHHNMK